jgi:hypothetical protein
MACKMYLDALNGTKKAMVSFKVNPLLHLAGLKTVTKLNIRG